MSAESSSTTPTVTAVTTTMSGISVSLPSTFPSSSTLAPTQSVLLTLEVLVKIVQRVVQANASASSRGTPVVSTTTPKSVPPSAVPLMTHPSLTSSTGRLCCAIMLHTCLFLSGCLCRWFAQIPGHAWRCMIDSM